MSWLSRIEHLESQQSSHMDEQVSRLFCTQRSNFGMQTDTALSQHLSVPCKIVLMSSLDPWAAWYNTWLLVELTPKGVVFRFFFFSR